jgi:hypothetical protein
LRIFVQEIGDRDNWRRAAAWTALISALVFVGLGAGMITLNSGPHVSDPELSFAIARPVLYRITMVLDVCAWLSGGAFFLAVAGMWAHRLPVRSLFLAVCGASQLVGASGASIRLVAVAGLAGATGDHQFVVQSYRTVALVIDSLFYTGEVLTGAAILLLAWSARTLIAFPQWLVVFAAIQGVASFVVVSAAFAGAPVPDLVQLFRALAWLITAIAISVILWRPARAVSPADSRSGGSR